MFKKILKLALVLILAGLGYLGYNIYQSRTQQQQTFGNIQTHKIQTGVLESTIDATGNVRSNQSVTLSWETSGIVESVNVEVGDQVQDGEVLASLEWGSLPTNIILAKSELETAEEALADLYDVAYSELALATAEDAYAAAVDEYEDAGYWLEFLNRGPDQVYVDEAYAEMVIAEDDFEDAKDDYDVWESKDEDNVNRAYYLLAYAQTEQVYDTTVREYNYLVSAASDIELAIAEAELNLAKAQMDEYLETYEELAAGPTQDEIDAAQAEVSAALATLSQAWVEAPLRGTITQAEPQPGDKVYADTHAFRIDDLSKMYVDLEVSEIDVNLVQIGQAVRLTLDAIDDREYSGEVVEISPVGYASDGVVYFEVTILLLEPDEYVKPEMSATAEIIIRQLAGITLVPNKAVRILEDQKVVFVYNETAERKYVPVPVQLGVTDGAHSELLSGNLQAGDTIMLNPPDETTAPDGNTRAGFLSGPGGNSGGGRP